MADVRITFGRLQKTVFGYSGHRLFRIRLVLSTKTRNNWENCLIFPIARANTFGQKIRFWTFRSSNPLLSEWPEFVEFKFKLKKKKVQISFNIIFKWRKFNSKFCICEPAFWSHESYTALPKILPTRLNVLLNHFYFFPKWPKLSNTWHLSRDKKLLQA